MSQLKKLSIQGIRSFGYSEEHVQVVSFFSPVTLIVGPNGTGKTTVIECLRYATCGELPPGSKQCGAFVFDPKTAGYSEVRGQVRLSFIDVTGKAMRVQRSLVATLKKTGVSVRTLEGLIVREGDDGNVHQITSRCTEIDKEVMTALGVPKAVLENVIFCHQEDSNWPLSEGKVLKSKFDDIFAATKYIKILDTLRKARQDKAQELKLHRAEIVHLRRYRDKAKSLRDSLDETKAKKEECIEKIAQIKNKLIPVEEKLQKITKEAKRVYEMQRSIDVLENRKKSLQDQISELRSHTKETSTDISAIRLKLQGLETATYQNGLKLSSAKNDLRSLSDKQTRTRRELDEITRQIVELDVDRKAADDARNKQEQICDELRTICKCSPDGLTATLVPELSKEMHKNLLDLQTTNETELNKIELELDQAKLMAAQHSEKLNINQANKAKITEELSDLSDKLKESQQLLESIGVLERDIEQLELAAKRLEDKLKEDLETKTVELEKEQNRLSCEMRECQEQLDELLASSKKAMEFDLTKQNIRSKQQQLDRIRYRNEDTVKELLEDAELSQQKQVAENNLRSMNARLEEFSKEMQHIRSQLVTKEECRRMKELAVADMEKDVGNIKQQLCQFASSFEEYNSFLAQKQSEVDTKREDYGLMHGTQNTYRKFIKRMKEQKSDDMSCPLCCRKFDRNQDAVDLMRDMETLIQTLPSKMSLLEKDIKDCETSFEQLVGLRPQFSRMEDLTCKLEAGKKEIEQLTAEISDLRRQINKAENDAANTIRHKSKLEELLPDILLVDRLHTEISNLNERLSSDYGDFVEPTGNAEEVKARRDEIRTKLESVVENLRQIQRERAESTKELEKVREELACKRRSRFKAAEASLNEQNLKQRQEKATAELKCLTDEIALNERALSKAQERVAIIEKNKAEQVRSNKAKVRAMEDELRTVNGLIDKFLDCQKVIVRSVEYSEPKQAKLLVQRESLESTQRQLIAQSSELTKQIEEYQQMLNNHDVEARSLKDAIHLCEKQLELDAVNEKIQLEMEEFSGLQVKDLASDEKALRSQQEELLKDKHTTSGRLAGLDNQISEIENELSEDNYLNADRDYMQRMITVQVLESACSDIEKFYSALDKAVMTHHSSKMSELNKIIRDLWSTTYKGNDIDYIEIRSEAEDASGAAKARRSYNYRVVMVRSGVPMDMRGRCSAGQKVLASLIIRLALAEAFGVQCGIIALDEPTTNLDRENIESLAYSLLDIIESRCVQRQFQLVVITHDEDFVEMLSRSNFVEKFYRIQKDLKGFSRIYTCDTSELR